MIPGETNRIKQKIPATLPLRGFILEEVPSRFELL